MASILFRILIFVFILWLLRRFFASLRGIPKHTATKQNDDIPVNNMVKDPVCGMYMDSRLALRVENGSGTYYFCSDACKREFMGKASHA